MLPSLPPSFLLLLRFSSLLFSSRLFSSRLFSRRPSSLLRSSLLFRSVFFSTPSFGATPAAASVSPRPLDSRTPQRRLNLAPPLFVRPRPFFFRSIFRSFDPLFLRFYFSTSSFPRFRVASLSTLYFRQSSHSWAKRPPPRRSQCWTSIAKNIQQRRTRT